MESREKKSNGVDEWGSRGWEMTCNRTASSCAHGSAAATASKGAAYESDETDEGHPDAGVLERLARLERVSDDVHELCQHQASHRRLGPEISQLASRVEKVRTTLIARAPWPPSSGRSPAAYRRSKERTSSPPRRKKSEMGRAASTVRWKHGDRSQRCRSNTGAVQRGSHQGCIRSSSRSVGVKLPSD